MANSSTRQWRRAMNAYRKNWGLEKEDGFTIETGKPLGKPARALLLRIQKNLHARDVLGSKYVDGTLNTKTKELLIPPLSMADKVVAKAVGQRGVHESPWGRNTGKDVRKYQSVTRAYYAPWCASFAWWCWRQAGYVGPVSAGAWYSTDRIGVRQSIHTAKPGDLVSLDVGEGHVGILLKVNIRQGTVTLMAGNTSDSVKEKDYSIASIHSITRPFHRG